MEERNNSGVLFRNNKGGNERKPDYTGHAMVDGKSVRLAAWVRTSTTGNKYLSVAFSEDEPQQTQDAPKATPSPQPTAPEDDLPF